MLKDCKYRLPCNWCDKYDRMCESVLTEIHNQQYECEHDWELRESEPTDYTDSYADGYSKRYYNNKYVCKKCGKEEVRFTTNIYNI